MSTARLVFSACWQEAMDGCDYVLHVASPLGMNSPRDPDALIVPARDGTSACWPPRPRPASEGS